MFCPSKSHLFSCRFQTEREKNPSSTTRTRKLTWNRELFYYAKQVPNEVRSWNLDWAICACGDEWISNCWLPLGDCWSEIGAINGRPNKNKPRICRLKSEWIPFGSPPFSLLPEKKDRSRAIFAWGKNPFNKSNPFQAIDASISQAKLV